MSRRGARTVLLGFLASLAIVYGAIAVLGVAAGEVWQHLLMCLGLSALMFIAALLVSVLIWIIRGAR